ncbi:MAG: VWA domain-containing protein [Microthrixaceae bacterium]
MPVSMRCCRHARGRAPDIEELVVERWRGASTAWCLLVDRSGSMSGNRVATAAIAAAAVASRAPTDSSVLAFAGGDGAAPPGRDRRRRHRRSTVAARHGTTDLSAALGEAYRQLGRSTARDRRVLLLSDCRSTSGPDPAEAATRLAAIADLVVLAPKGDTEDAEAFAASVGARWAAIEHPTELPTLLERLDRPRGPNGPGPASR